MVGRVTQDLHFRVLYRKKGMPKSEQWNFTAPDGDALLKMLARTEDVSPETCDLLVVHCYLPTGDTVEIICHEPKEVVGSDRSRVVIPMRHEEGSEQERVLSATFELLSRGRDEAQRIAKEEDAMTPPIPSLPVVSSKPKKNVVLAQHKGARQVAGFGVCAYPAMTGEEQEE